MKVNLRPPRRTLNNNHRTLDRRQRKIRDDQLNSAILSAELAKTADPLAEVLAKIEAQLITAVTKDQVAAIIIDLQTIQTKLSLVTSLRNEFDLVQRQLETTLTAADIMPLVEDLSELKAQLNKMQASLNRPKVLLPSPVKEEKGPKPK